MNAVTPSDRESAALADRVQSVAALLCAELRTGSTDPVHSLATARSLSALAGDALAALVRDARARGISWQGIGAALGTSRQAAFQRFGTPLDPRTGDPMDRTIPAGVADRAGTFFDNLRNGDFAAAATDFSPVMREQLGAAGLGDAYARVVAMGGPVKRTGTPAVLGMGDVTVVEVPLHLEAADLVGRISYAADGSVVGLWFLPTAQRLTEPS